MVIKYCKCIDCEYKTKYGRCRKRQFMIDYKFIRVWGCDDFKPKYETLLKEDD